MSNFTSIESFKHVIKTVERINASPSTFKVVDPVIYRGTVKLHGTNGGVEIFKDKRVQAHSRTRPITMERDNAGFALFVAQREEAFHKLFNKVIAVSTLFLEPPEFHSVTFWGEFVGVGIQKGVAINNLPEKQFVIFSIRLNTDESEPNIYLNEDELDHIVNDLDEYSVYRISRVPTYELTADFLDRVSIQAALEKSENLAKQVGDCCPWAKLFDIEGLGEGIVWKPIGKYAGKTDLFFKSKDDRHKNVNETKTKATIDLAVLENIQSFVAFAVTDNRLNQGIEELKAAGHPIEARSTGHFIKWVSSDVYKECQNELVANGLEWKKTVKHVVEKARAFWLRETSKI